MSHRVDIGFLEKTESWLLKSNYFPSKIGGKPAWLDLQLPTIEELQCKICEQPMVFLSQLYAPIDEKETCFHRALFIFICRNGDCCTPNTNNNLLVMRCQLPRNNKFYPSEPPVEDRNNTFEMTKYVKTCSVCGAFASKHCSKCKSVSYCSRNHQIFDWKRNHKSICGTGQEVDAISSLLFEEWELIIEAEDVKEEVEESVEQDEKRRMEDYERLVAAGKVGTLSDEPEKDLQDFSSVDEDKVFLMFRKHMADKPDQVIRYERGGTPLWIATDPVPVEIPKCELCGAARQFELQILPQLLHSLHEYTLDWGTLAVFTCKDNCDMGPAYKSEYLFKQDISGGLENK